MNNVHRKEIISLARQIKKCWQTNDPYEIADKLGIVIMECNSVLKDFTANIVKRPGFPTVISINEKYDDFSKRLLCAHELGHALLHDNSFNSFGTTKNNAYTDVELEANLFALALIGDNLIDSRLNTPLDKMGNYLLKSIIDYNLNLR